MHYTAPKQINEVRSITRSAVNQIKDKTGMEISLMLCPEYHSSRSPDQMLRIIAAALQMDVNAYKVKSRERNIVELRFIVAFFLRSYFPCITLQQITRLFGGQDHTSVMNGLSRTAMLLATGDQRFITKYETALNSVNKWLRKEVSGYASAASA